MDRLRKIQSSGKDFLDQMCQRETERTGISSLKIAFNNVFGYYIEVRNTHKDKVPEEWIRKQTLVNAERYITEELKEYETQILGAEEKILAIENQLFIDLLQEIITKLLPIQQIAKAIAFLDVLSTFAEIAEKKSKRAVCSADIAGRRCAACPSSRNRSHPHRSRQMRRRGEKRAAS